MRFIRVLAAGLAWASLSASSATLPTDSFLYPADSEVEFLAGLSGTVSVNFARKLLVKCADGTAEPKYADLCRMGAWLEEDRRSVEEFPWAELNAQVLYFGEMHMGQESKTFLTEHMGDLKRQGVGAVAMEMFNSTNQPILDRYLANEATIDEVKTALVREWNYESQGYLNILAAAKANGMKLIALDDRSDGWSGGFLTAIVKRDAHMAQVIAQAIKNDPGLRIAVLCGRMHSYGVFSTENLILSQPAVLRETYGISTQSLMVFSDREVGNVGPNNLQKAIMGEGVSSILKSPAGYAFTDYFLFLRYPAAPVPLYNFPGEPSPEVKLKHID